MATQVSYPGIYIQEFAPQPPIQGVSTSIGCFIGTATMGPVNTPTMITSWDQFQTIFGGFINELSNSPYRSWLAPAVYGFFLNQGTNCYVLRVASSSQASLTLLDAGGQQTLVATSIAEGSIANSISLTVTNSSLLALMLASAAPALQATQALLKNQTTIPVSLPQSLASLSIPANTTVVVSLGGTSETVQTNSWTITTAPTATAPGVATIGLAGTGLANNYGSGSDFAFAQISPVFQTPGALSSGATTISVSIPWGLTAALPQSGAIISVTQSGTSETITVASTTITTQPTPSTPGAAVIQLATGLVHSYGGPPYAVIATVVPSELATTAAVTAGALSLNVALASTPGAFALSQALPAGALIQIGGASGEYVAVASTSVSGSVGTITLATPLQNSYAASTPIASAEFTLAVSAATQETWAYLSMNSQDPRYWQTIVQSQLITLSLPSPAPVFPTTPVPNTSPQPLAATTLSGGADDNRQNDLNNLNANPDFYLNLLTPIQNVDLIAVPGNTNANLQQTLVAYCEQQFNRFAVLDGVQDSAPGFPNLLAQYGQVRSPNGFAAIYFPWIQAVNPLTGATEYWPPSGHVTGCIAQTDLTVGVFKAPANVPIAGALGLSSQLSNADQGPLNLLGINILRVFPEQSQPLIWGARTPSTDSSWRYINVRRLFIYIEQSLEQGLRPFIFQPNNSFLWGSMNRTITEFLNRVQSSGGIISFYVKIDATNNPPSVQALGQLYAEVGIQPAYPAEFIILKIGIWDGGSSVTES